MLLSYNQLVSKIVKGGVIKNALLDNVNGSSIDIRLGGVILVESHPKVVCPHCEKEIREQLDIHLHVRAERHQMIQCPHCYNTSAYSQFIEPIDISKKQPLAMEEVSCEKEYTLWPGEAVLGQSVEIFYLPANITAEYRLKSSMARVFLEHLHAGWCDPMWQGSVLTLELVNMSKYHPIILKVGMKIGQMCFYYHDPVPLDKSYAVKGRYNGDTKATASKGLR